MGKFLSVRGQSPLRWLWASLITCFLALVIINWHLLVKISLLSLSKDSSLSFLPIFNSDDYEREKILGKGGFGVVYRVSKKQDDKSNSPFYAMKVFSKASELENEIKIFRLIKPHPLIVHPLARSADKKKLLMELVNGPNLHQLLYQRYQRDKEARILQTRTEEKSLDDPELLGMFPTHFVKHVIKQLVQVTVFLHSQGILIRDLKASNVLVDRDTGRIKMIDFNMAQVMFQIKNGKPQQNSLHAVGNRGTASYKAPEVLMGGLLLDTRSDWWSLGVVAYKLMTVNGRLPFDKHEDKQLKSWYFQALDENVQVPFKLIDEQHFGTGARDFLRGLLERNPEKRLATADKILDHPWLKEEDALNVDPGIHHCAQCANVVNESLRLETEETNKQE